MKDAYSFDRDFDGLDRFYPRIYQAYFDIFRRCGLDVIAVESDTGMMGGTMAHEFMALTPVGEDTLLLCDDCGYSANRQIAIFHKPEPVSTEVLPREEVYTPGVDTIGELAEFLNISEASTAKAIFMIAEIEDESSGQAREQFVFAVVRGDMDLNETKLTNVLRARQLRPATSEEIRGVGAEPGFGSPIGIDRSQVMLIVDDLIVRSPNLVAGANRADYHFRNVNYGRDYSADKVADIVAAAEGYECPTCRAHMRAVRGVEVGNIFKLGTKYSEAMGATFLDEEGNARPIVMGSYGIGSGRLIASVIEHHHDEYGIKWPITIAPYQVVLISLSTERTPEVTEAANHIYKQFRDAGVEILYDERDERAGVKFNDADLLGIPIRLTLGTKGLRNGVAEMKLRRSGEEQEIVLENLVMEVQAIIDAELALIKSTVVKEEVGA
jgi:prolyl-tRNA synthetase